MVKRIAVLSTSGKTPMFIQSVFDDGILTFADPEPLPPVSIKLREEALIRLPKLVKRGDTVLVDEYRGAIARECGAKAISLSMVESDKPVIVRAFGLYREMKRQHAILLPAKNPGAFDISDSLVNEQHNSKGEISYHIDWENIRPEQYLMLLSVFATSFNDVGSAEYFKAIMGKPEQEYNPTSPLHKIVAQQALKDAKPIGSSLAGQKVSDTEWYF